MVAHGRTPTGSAGRGEVRFGEQIVVYALERRRRRSLGFIVGPQGLSVHAPIGLDRAAIDAALQTKSAWILAKLAEQRERARHADAARIEWREGGLLPYLGRPLILTLDASCRTAKLEGAAEAIEHPPDLALDLAFKLARELTPKLMPGLASERASEPTPRDLAGAAGPRRLRLPLPADAAAEAVAAAARRWLQTEARRLFADRCAHFAPQVGVQPRAIRLSSARTRWGSASANGTVRLNRRLVHLPLACTDYVVVHELAHLREMNHGPRFWAIVGSVLPGYAALRRELRKVQLPTLD